MFAKYTGGLLWSGLGTPGKGNAFSHGPNNDQPNPKLALIARSGHCTKIGEEMISAGAPLERAILETANIMVGQ